jgi:hypothetical protein
MIGLRIVLPLQRLAWTWLNIPGRQCQAGVDGLAINQVQW